MNKFLKALGFNAEEKKTTIRTEIVAGIVTFLAMAYILVLNPILMLNGTNEHLFSSVFIATALGAVVGTLLMAFLAKLPLAQAPGLGLNSMVGGLLGGGLIGAALSFGASMLMVLISGVLFLVLSVLKLKGISVREIIYKAIPESVRGAISVGIGLFIAFIGLYNSGNGIIVGGLGTPVDLVAFNTWDMALLAQPLVLLVGFVVIAILSHFNVKGAVIIGIIAATLFGLIPAINVTTWSNQSWKFWENFSGFFSFDVAKGGTFFAAFTDINFGGASVMSLIMVIITFCMIDMFDTMGTCVGCCSAAGLMTEEGTPKNYNQIMVADSVATCAGALFGTSTVTTFVESGAGVSAGGKTGITALTTACMFLLSIFIFPIIASIPGAAANAALIWVGCLMLKGVKNIKVDSVKDFVPAFLTVAIMPLGYSITDGIGLGMLSYVLICVCGYLFDLISYACSKKEGKEKPVWDVHIVTIIIAVLFLVYFFVPTAF